ncbi:hypothetical protein BXU11_09265 [Flavobacterium sp. LM5]|uniref:hypothetical protein n=1 Tax=Flavobacterium sp. LM5 TaxID=1938610 RepID=UPI0009C8A518|nr:hypothetical protein [Flavobacterium sp. LM5]OOV27642.1 hypothetical protein BXU11_09265 [Flavobacterium sp. LM5]
MQLKKIGVHLLTLTLLFPIFGNLAIYTQFKANQEQIIKTICVQRKLVNNTCNGRCELQKSLKKFDENEKKMENILKEKADFVYLIHSTPTSFVSNTLITSTTKLNVFHTSGKTISKTNSTFRPPSFLL